MDRLALIRNDFWCSTLFCLDCSCSVLSLLIADSYHHHHHHLKKTFTSYVHIIIKYRKLPLVIWILHPETNKEKKRRQGRLRIADSAAPAALPRRPLTAGAEHVRRVPGALPRRGPLRAALAPVGAPAVGFLGEHEYSRGFVLVRPHVDPLGRRPLLAPDHRAAPVEAERVRRAVGVQAEEEHGVAFHRFHCTRAASKQ